MAAFNPPVVPTNDPEYLNRSKAVDVPGSIRPEGQATNTIMPEGNKHVDKTGEYAGAGAAAAGKYAGMAAGAGITMLGDLFAGIGKVADFAGKAGVKLVEDHITNKLYESVNQERQDYTERLELLQKAPGLGKALGLKGDVYAQATDDDAAQANIPADVAQMESNVQTLQEGLQQGKYNHTYYYQRLLTLTKDMRERHPGFREHIDKTVASITGVNPANAYINQLLSSINQNERALGSNGQKEEAFFRRKDVMELPIAPQLYNDWKTGRKSFDQVYGDVSGELSKKYEFDARQRRRTEIGNSREDRQVYAADEANAVFNSIATTRISSVVVANGVETPAQVVDTLTQYAAGTLKVDEGKARQMGAQIAIAEQHARMDMRKKSDESGLTKDFKNGIKDRDEKIEAALQPFKDIKRLIDEKEFGAAYMGVHMMKAMENSDTRAMLEHPEIGFMMRQLVAAKNLGGPQFASEYFLGLLKQRFPEKYKMFTTEQMLKMTTQPEAGTGKVHTLNRAFQVAKEKGVDIKETPNMFLNFVNMIEKAGEDKTPIPVRETLLLAAFHPDNHGFIGKFGRDGVKENGQPIHGMYKVYEQLGSEKLQNAVYSTKNPQLQSYYKRWVESEAGILLEKEMKDFKDLRLTAKERLTWNSDQNRFSLVDPSGNSMLGDRNPNTSHKRMVNNINRVMPVLARMAEKEGLDVNSYIIERMNRMGADFGGQVPPGFPTYVSNAVKAAHDEQQKNSNATKSIRDRWNLK